MSAPTGRLFIDDNDNPVPGGVTTLSNLIVSDSTIVAGSVNAKAVALVDESGSQIGTSTNPILIGNRSQTQAYSTNSSGAQTAFDVSAYASVAVDIISDLSGGNTTFQVSNDNSNWRNIILARTDANDLSATPGATGQMYSGNLMGAHYFRLNLGGSGGTAAGTIQFSTQPITPAIIGTSLNSNGSNLGYTSSTDGISNGIFSLISYTMSLVYTGSQWGALRTPNVFKSFSAQAITSETTIWTPTTGKKFRLMGFVITQTVLTGDITVRDNTSGSTILTIPATPVGQPLPLQMGNGILSASANNVLTFQGVSTEKVSGFVYGTEE